MIERYTRPRMGAIWKEEAKYARWLRIETLAAEAMARLGRIPPEAAREIRRKGAFDVRRIDEIEQEVHHDVIAFLTSVTEHVGESGRYLHLGMTSSDILDTGLAMAMKEAGEILIEDLDALGAVLGRRAMEFKNTPCVGRSHGIHAEPTSFGLKLLLWLAEMERNRARLTRAIAGISVGQISGAVGNFAHLDPRVEEQVCRELGLTPAPISTQILQRDRHAEYLCCLAIIAASLEKIATEIRSLQRTEILEAEEPFGRGQKGSSAMPHKRNPIVCERVAGLARILRGNALAALENVALWHERDITHSSVERVIVPDSTILLDYMLGLLTRVLDGLLVYPQNMMANLRRTRGLVFSQALLLALVEKGITREEAYQRVQAAALAVWNSDREFLDAALASAEIREQMSEQEIRSCFDLAGSLRHVDAIFQRVMDAKA